MSEEEKNKYAFLVIRKENGDVGVQSSAEDTDLSMNDIYESICTLKSNIEAQQTSAMVTQGIVQVMQHMQTQAQQTEAGPKDGTKRTEGGLVLVN